MSPISLLSFCTIWITCVHGDPQQTIYKKPRRTNSLVKYITEDAGKHQVMLLIDDENSVGVDDLVEKIAQNFPIQFTILDHSTGSCTGCRNLGNNPRETTLFIMIFDADKDTFSSQLSGPTQFLTSISNENARPKCLIIHLTNSGNFTYQKDLEKLWGEQFLDVTVLQLTQADSSPDNVLLNRKRKVPTLHQYNPYNEQYNKRSSWSKSQWFPEKGKDLYGYKMQVLVPGKLESRFKSLHLFQVLSQKLNFTMNFTKAVGKELGQFGCSRNQFTGKISDLIRNKVQFVLTQYQYFHNCHRPLYLRSHVVQMSTTVAVVPRLPIQVSTQVVSWKFVYAILGIALSIVILRIVLLALKFNNDTWQSINIVGVILGIGFPDAPNCIRERIVLGSILLTSIIYTGYIHSLLTDEGLKATDEKDIKTIEDLSISGLVTFMTPFLLSKSADTIDISYFKELRESSLPYLVNFPLSGCLDHLVMHKNLSCTMSTSTASSKIASYIKESGIQEMKIVEQPLLYAARVWFIEPGAPYIDDFNHLLLKLVDTGLMSKWNCYDSQKGEFPIKDSFERYESDTLFRRLLLILVVVYLLASIAFVVEVVVSRFDTKRVKRIHDARRREKLRARQALLME